MRVRRKTTSEAIEGEKEIYLFERMGTYVDGEVQYPGPALLREDRC